MKRAVKIGFPIACVVIVGGTLIALGNLQNKASEIANKKAENKIINSVNKVYENKIDDSEYNYQYDYEDDNYITENENNIIDEEITNNTIDNATSNTTNTNAKNTVTNTNSVNNKNNVSTEETEEKNNVSDKDKAIAMVQAEWGSDSSVYFTSEGISGGNYIVAVRDKSNTSVKMFYKVNLENNTVEIDW